MSDALTGIFDWVGIRTNVGKMLDMICQPCHNVGTHSDASYESIMAGGGLMYRVR